MDILSTNKLKIKDDLIIVLSQKHKNENKSDRKILKISSELNFDAILHKLRGLKSVNYPNLFVFIIEVESLSKLNDDYAVKSKECVLRVKAIDKLKNILLEFDNFRPILIQMSSKKEKNAIFSYKNENSNRFKDFDLQHSKMNVQEFECFSSFLSFFINEPKEYFETRLVEKLHFTEDTVLILRFLSLFELSENLNLLIFLKVAKKGSKNDLRAALDISFHDKSKILSRETPNFLLCYSENKPGSRDCDSYTSVLYEAVENKNVDIINYLISFWTHLIQELPFEHQIKISTSAFKLNQFDTLCNLLEISDFPFPQNFDEIYSTNPDLIKVIEQRKELKKAIDSESFDGIEFFFRNNINLRSAYILNNKKAIRYAIENKKYISYCHLITLGYKDQECENLDEVLKDDELEDIKSAVRKYRKESANNALSDDQKSIYRMLIKSFIHNKKIEKCQEKVYRGYIKKWYEDISKLKNGLEFLTVAASCEKLKIIFDFESKTVSSVQNFKDF